MIDNELQHHGVKGQRWGVRRYQNKDGSLTALGERRVAKLDARKKAEELKSKRVERKLSIQRARQDMREDALDRKTNRNIAKENAKNVRDIAKADAKNARDITKADSKANRNNLPEEETYVLPETYDAPQARQSANTGKLIVGAALAALAIGTAAYAFKKFKGNKAAKQKTEEAVKKASKDAHDKYINNTKKQLEKLRKKKKASEVKLAKSETKAGIKSARDLRKGLKNFNKTSRFKGLFKNFNVPIS